MQLFKFLFFIIASFFICASSSAQKLGDAAYEPILGQFGKDVMWLPTADTLLLTMLETAKVGPSDLVYDLGAGDGKIAIAAAQKFGARAIGIEYNPKMAALAQRNAMRAGVADKVEIIQGDIFTEDFSKASVVTLYLLPELNMQLRPTLLSMKPGTRVVSHQFDMEDWEADIKIGDPVRAYYWVVPANIEGDWLIKGLNIKEPVTLTLSQKFQKVTGAITIGTHVQTLKNPTLAGNTLKFTFKYKEQLQDVLLTISDGKFNGQSSLLSNVRKISATKMN
jgi:SAM-dependent methyltransferase